MVPPEERARDVYADRRSRYRRGRMCRADRIAAMGFSHGGWTVLDAAAADRAVLASGREALAGHGKLAAFVALYPGCANTERDEFIGPVLDPGRRLGRPLAVRDMSSGWPAVTIRQPEIRRRSIPAPSHDFDYGRGEAVVLRRHADSPMTADAAGR